MNGATMKVLNLRCTHDHPFEGWFASEDDYQSQQARGLMTCPMCGDNTIARLPSAPRLNVSKSHDMAAPASQSTAEPATMQAVWMRAVQHVLNNTVDVGSQFAEEARRIHYGEAEERAIRGQATRDDAEALRDEGIDVIAFPALGADKGTLQ